MIQIYILGSPLVALVAASAPSTRGGRWGGVGGVVGQLLLLGGESATLRLRAADARHVCAATRNNTRQNCGHMPS